MGDEQLTATGAERNEICFELCVPHGRGGRVLAVAFDLGPSDEPPGHRRSGRKRATAPDPIPHDDLAYTVELWDVATSTVEQIVAVTSSASIGYAAYYAATREFPDAIITLRHKNRVMSKWDGKPN